MLKGSFTVCFDVIGTVADDQGLIMDPIRGLSCV